MDILMKGITAMVAVLLGTLVLTSVLAFNLDRQANPDEAYSPAVTATAR
jgi:hypothetical protein